MNYTLDKQNVKIIGRTFMQEDILWCGLSGSGIAFTMEGTRAEITLVGDDTTAGNETEGKARVGILVNGVRVIDTMVTEPMQSYIVHESDIPQKIEVQVIKLSECAMSTVGITKLEADTIDGIHPLPQAKRRIEFIGDSITCGFGVDLEDPEAPFQTDIEDVTKAYAYRVAKLLDADYSMVSYSGYGIISGYTDTDTPQTEQLVPNYYENIGFSYAHPQGSLKLQDLKWNFTDFQPDLIVINLGTNDDSYCQDYADRQEYFTKQYVSFLKRVRSLNPQAKLVCTIGLMCQRIAPAVETAVNTYKAQENDSAAYFCLQTEQHPSDGLAASSHPTAASHKKCAAQLAACLAPLL